MHGILRPGIVCICSESARQSRWEKRQKRPETGKIRRLGWLFPSQQMRSSGSSLAQSMGAYFGNAQELTLVRRGQTSTKHHQSSRIWRKGSSRFAQSEALQAQNFKSHRRRRSGGQLWPEPWKVRLRSGPMNPRVAKLFENVRAHGEAVKSRNSVAAANWWLSRSGNSDALGLCGRFAKQSNQRGSWIVRYCPESVFRQQAWSQALISNATHEPKPEV